MELLAHTTVGHDGITVVFCLAAAADRLVELARCLFSIFSGGPLFI